MEEGKMPESHLTSAAAFVEGGIQEACDDACSICLEAFCDSDPSTLTGCKHEFHLQCILEWCQRSSQCPMCWQPISLKDPSSQELLDAVEHERNLRMNPSRNTTIFHHPTLGDFELQHLPVSASESELEERIIQHLAAAAAMGRARHFARREGHRNRSAAHGRPQFLVFSTNPTGASATSAASSIAQREGSDMPPSVTTTGSNSPLLTVGEDSTAQPSSVQANQLISTAAATSGGGHPYTNRTSPAQTSPSSQDRAGPSDFQLFSESLKSRLSAFSTKYKESITRSTRSWKERLFARNNSSATPEPSNEPIHREGAQEVATVSRMMDHLDIAQDAQTGISTRSNDNEDVASPDQPDRHITVSPTSPSNEVSPRAPPGAAATTSVSN